MELDRNVYQIRSLFGGRNLFQYLFVGDNVVLVDTGIATTPDEVIFPYMDRLKLNPHQLTMAITTHADLDHQGGNAAIKHASANTYLACGEADRLLVEDPRTLFDQRYNFLRRTTMSALTLNPGPRPASRNGWTSHSAVGKGSGSETIGISRCFMFLAIRMGTWRFTTPSIGLFLPAMLFMGEVARRPREAWPSL